VYGCAHASTPHPWSFSLTTGKAAFTGSVSASTCGGSFAGVGGYGAASSSGGSEAAIKLSLPNGNHAVNINVNASWSTAGSVSGSGACPTRSYHYVNPSNSSQYYYATYGDCYASADAYLIGYAYLMDVTNGTTVTPTNASYYGYYVLYGIHSAQKYHSIYYGCQSGYGNSSGRHCFSYNFSSSGPTTFSSIGTALGFANFQGTFNHAHTYALLFFVSGALSAYTNGWSNGKASATLNAGSYGTGITLTRILVI
jgi:hypothetical protein